MTLVNVKLLQEFCQSVGYRFLFVPLRITGKITGSHSHRVELYIFIDLVDEIIKYQNRVRPGDFRKPYFIKSKDYCEVVSHTESKICTSQRLARDDAAKKILDNIGYLRKIIPEFDVISNEKRLEMYVKSCKPILKPRKGCITFFIDENIESVPENLIKGYYLEDIHIILFNSGNDTLVDRERCIRINSYVTNSIFPCKRYTLGKPLIEHVNFTYSSAYSMLAKLCCIDRSYGTGDNQIIIISKKNTEISRMLRDYKNVYNTDALNVSVVYTDTENAIINAYCRVYAYNKL